MKRFSDVSGMPVICADTGEKAGTVETVVCDKRDNVLGFLINSGKIGNKYSFISLKDVISEKNENISVLDESRIIRKREDVRNYRKNRNWVWLNKKVRANDGKLLGIVKDGIFDVYSGKISEIELSLGVIEDFRDGRKKFNINEDTEFGEEYIVLNEK